MRRENVNRDADNFGNGGRLADLLAVALEAFAYTESVAFLRGYREEA
jgi:hypothetical protein